MITPAFAQTMARYNAWQNGSMYAAADALDDTARLSDQGLFFRSIQGTLNHLLWADRIWLTRFAGTPGPNQKSIPQSTNETANWQTLKADRHKQDTLIAEWAAGLTQEDINGELTWFSGALGKEVSRPAATTITHFFNHQTHHRGQVHGALTRLKAHPDDTDLFVMPDGA